MATQKSLQKLTESEKEQLQELKELKRVVEARKRREATQTPIEAVSAPISPPKGVVPAGVPAQLYQLYKDKLKRKEPITPEEIAQFTQAEVDSFSAYIDSQFTSLKDTALDRFLIVVDLLMGKENKNRMWERNHLTIMGTINNFILDHNFMPAVSRVAELTGLSRQTVNEHIKNFNQAGVFTEMERFRFLAPHLIGMVYKSAIDGDTRAARLFFDVLGYTSKPAPSQNIKNQQNNNFITINGVVLTEEQINNLPREVLDQVQTLLLANQAKVLPMTS